MEITDEIVPVYKSYKDRVFRLLFKDKKRLLELYNALNDTCYTDENALEILNKCKTLCEYAYFVEETRRHCQSMTMEEAVTTAVNECIEKGILKDF